IARLDQLVDPGRLEDGQHLRHQTRLGRFAAGIHVIDFRSRHDALLCCGPRVPSTCAASASPPRYHRLWSLREVESFSSVRAIIAYCALENKVLLLNPSDRDVPSSTLINRSGLPTHLHTAGRHDLLRE